MGTGPGCIPPVKEETKRLTSITMQHIHKHQSNPRKNQAYQLVPWVPVLALVRVLHLPSVEAASSVGLRSHAYLAVSQKINRRLLVNTVNKQNGLTDHEPNSDKTHNL